MGKDFWSKAGAYFVIIIMVFSTVGFALYFYNPSNNQGPKPDTNTPVQDFTPMNYTAKVTGTVKEILKTYWFVGDTNNANITALDQNIMKIEGVSTVESKYILNSDPSITATYKYVATISGYNIDENKIYDQVNEAVGDQFTSVGVFPYALVTFGNDVLFTNSDLNTTKSYTFGNPIASVLIFPTTKRDDKIDLQLNATFINNSPSQVTGYQIEPQQKMAQFFKTAKFTPKNVTIAVSGVDLNKVDVNSLEQSFDGNTTLNPDSLLFVSEDLNQDLFVSDLNNALKDLNVAIETKIVGKVFVDKFDYLGETYTYNKDVDVFLDYGNYDLNKEIDFMMQAYLYGYNVMYVMGQSYAPSNSITLDVGNKSESNVVINDVNN